jgi:hypothetical protein
MDHPYLVLFGKHSSENANGPQLNDATEVLCGLCHRCSPIAMPLCDFLQIESADTAAPCPLCSSQSEDTQSNEDWGRGIKVGRWKFLRHINVDRFQSSPKLETLMQVRTRT